MDIENYCKSVDASVKTKELSEEEGAVLKDIATLLTAFEGTISRDEFLELSDRIVEELEKVLKSKNSEISKMFTDELDRFTPVFNSILKTVLFANFSGAPDAKLDS